MGIKTYIKTPEAAEQNKKLGMKILKVGIDDLCDKNELQLTKTDFTFSITNSFLTKNKYTKNKSIDTINQKIRSMY